MVNFLVANVVYLQIIAAITGVIAAALTVIQYIRTRRMRSAETINFSKLPVPTESDFVIVDFDERKKDIDGTFENVIAQFELQVSKSWKTGMLHNPEFQLQMARETSEYDFFLSKLVFVLFFMPAFALSSFMFFSGSNWLFCLEIAAFGLAIASPISIMFLINARRASNASLIISIYLHFLALNGISVSPVFSRQKRRQNDPVIPFPKVA